MAEENEEDQTRELIKKQYEQYQKTQDAERKLKVILLQVLEPAAYERMSNVRIANQELYTNTVNAVVYYYQKVKRKVTEQELLTLLAAQTARKEGSINIKRK